MVILSDITSWDKTGYLLDLAADLEPGHGLADLTDAVHPADLALVFRRVLGAGEGRRLAVGPPVQRHEAGGADVEGVVFVIVQLVFVCRVLIARLNIQA